MNPLRVINCAKRNLTTESQRIQKTVFIIISQCYLCLYGELLYDYVLYECGMTTKF